VSFGCLGKVKDAVKCTGFSCVSAVTGVRDGSDQATAMPLPIRGRYSVHKWGSIPGPSVKATKITYMACVVGSVTGQS
jgi:hypothetical protein